MQNSSQMKFNNSESWTILSDIEQSITRKIETVGVPLKDWDVNINYGIKTGLNEAFIISGAKKDELIAADPKSAEIIRPVLRGRDIQRYGYTFADLWLINTHNGVREQQIPRIDIEDYPAIKEYLDCFYTKLAKRADKGATPYNLRNCAYMDDLSMQKIIWGEISDKPKFAIDIDGIYCPEATTFLMTGSNLKYLFCFLNSNFSEYFFAKYGTTTGMGTLRWKKYLVELLPVPRIDDDTKLRFDAWSDTLISNDTQRDECISRINNEIFNLLGLTNEEVLFIENMIERGAH